MRVFNKLCFFLLCLCLTTEAQQVSWLVTSGGAQFQGGIACATFADGSILNAGIFQGQTTFYPGDNTPRNSRGGYDVFVQKLDTNGVAQWVVTFGGKGEELITDLAIDGEGNILLAGTFTDTCDFDPGNGVDIGISNGQTDMFIVKLDALGNFIWSRRFGGSSPDELNGLGVDLEDNIYIGGHFSDTVDFSTDSIPFTQISFGASSSFVIKLNGQGKRQWFRKYGDGWHAAGVHDIAVANDKLWVLGFHRSDSLNFGTAFEPLWLFSNEPAQTYLLQLDLEGDAFWVGEFGFNVKCNVISSDRNNNVLLTGFFAGNVDLDPGPAVYPVSTATYGDVFIIKLDSNANFLWAKTFTSDLGHVISGRKVISFGQGDVLLSADLRGTIDFDPGPGVVNRTSNGDIDATILHLDASGNFKWVHSFGGSGFDVVAGLSVFEEKFYATGAFRSTVDFNPGGPPYLLTANGSDACLIKFGSYSALSTPEYEKLQYKIYPNPSTGLIKVEGEFDFVQLLNLQGQMVYQQPNSGEMNTLDFSLFNEGIYLLKLIKHGRVSHLKVVIQR